MQETSKCVQCSSVFLSKSARKLHVRSCHQIFLRLTNSHGTAITIEKINGQFICPNLNCPYTSDKAGLMQSHYSRCRFRIRQSIPQLPQEPTSVRSRVVVPTRLILPEDEVEGKFSYFFAILVLTIDFGPFLLHRDPPIKRPGYHTTNKSQHPHLHQLQLLQWHFAQRTSQPSQETPPSLCSPRITRSIGATTSTSSGHLSAQSSHCSL